MQAAVGRSVRPDAPRRRPLSAPNRKVSTPTEPGLHRRATVQLTVKARAIPCRRANWLLVEHHARSHAPPLAHTRTHSVAALGSAAWQVHTASHKDAGTDGEVYLRSLP